MNHYDLYASLGVDRTASSAQITAAIKERITSSGTQNDARTEELSLALAILGDPARRELYDRQLDDPNAPEITVEAVRQLSTLPGSTATSAAASTSAFPSSTTKRHRGEQKNRPQWLIPAGVAAIVVMISITAITWMLISGKEASHTTAEPNMSFSSKPDDSDQLSEATSSPENSASRITTSPTAEKESERSESADAIQAEPMEYGVGLQVRESCGSSDTNATFVLTGRGTARCNFANSVGDRLANTKLREDSKTEISVYSPNQKSNVDLSCRKAQDSARLPLWKCTVRNSGSIVYIYP